jgi:hypothetical protein
LKWNNKQVASFAAWIKEQGALLHELRVYAADDVVDAWEQLITTALQLHSTSAAGCSPTASACVASSGSSTQHSSMAAAARLPLGLASLSWVRLQAPALLQALQSAPKLTDLQLLAPQAVTLGMLAALGRLTILHSLAVREGMPSHLRSGLLPQFAGTVGNLSRLTKLEFRYLDEVRADSLRLLPTSLCQLEVTVLPGQGGQSGQQAIPLAFLPRLESLRLFWEGEQASTARVDLPVTLTKLCVRGRVQTAAAVPAGVCYMELIDPALCTDLVNALPALSGLTTLKLRFTECSPEGVESFAPIVSVLTALSCLSKISVDNGLAQLSASTCQSAGFGRALGQLVSLRKVKFVGWRFDTTDALHLSALMQLTSLNVFCSGSGFNDMVVSSIAVCSTSLESLDISCCGVQSQYVFPVLAKLPKLRSLFMSGNDVIVDDLGLMRFASSTSLTRLELPITRDVTNNGMTRFYEAIEPHRMVVV